MHRRTLPLAVIGLAVLPLTALTVWGASTWSPEDHAGVDRSTEKLAVLDQVLLYRGHWLRDKEATVIACDAFEAVDRSPSFPEALRWAEGILEEKEEPCDGAPPPNAPRVQVRNIEITSTGATAHVRIIEQGGFFFERYELEVVREGTFRLVRVVASGFSVS